MAKRKQRGNGEGSIYEHKRDGRKVGYRGAYTVFREILATVLRPPHEQGHLPRSGRG
jgi:nitrogenase molybdenum-iron protein alpha/beta subunit